MEFALCHPLEPRYRKGRTLCESCFKERRKEEHQRDYAKHKEEIKARSRAYYNRPEVRARRKETDRSNGIGRLYGITQEQYEDLLRQQDGVCAICKKLNVHKHHLSGEVPRLFIDHDHLTGRVRGLLCMGCNSKLGWLEKYKQEIALYLKEGD